MKNSGPIASLVEAPEAPVVIEPIGPALKDRMLSAGFEWKVEGG